MNRDIGCAGCRPLLETMHDGELSSRDEELVRGHVVNCDDCARMLRSHANLSRRVQEGLVHYTAPDVLKARIRSALQESSADDAPVQHSAGWRRGWLVAAGLAIALASSGITYAAMERGLGNGQAAAVTNELLTSHVRSLIPGHLLDVASTDQHNVKPWFNGRVALSPPVPLLDSLDFKLLGGRLDYLDGHVVAVTVYARRQHVINVYAWPHPGPDVPESSRTTQGYHLVTWRSDDIEFWAVSDLNSTELMSFTRAYRGADTTPSRLP